MPDDPIIDQPDPPVDAPVDPPADPVSDPPDDFDKERAMALIAKLRPFEKQAGVEKKRADELETRLRALEDRDKSEEEKRAERLAALEQQNSASDIELQTLRLKVAVYGAASTVGLADADLALAALDRSQIVFDDSGQPSNIAEVLTALVEAKPLLKGAPVQTPVGAGINAGSGQTNGKRPDLTADELDAAQRMGITPDEYAAYKGTRSIGDFRDVERTLAASTAA